MMNQINQIDDYDFIQAEKIVLMSIRFEFLDYSTLCKPNHS